MCSASYAVETHIYVCPRGLGMFCYLGVQCRESEERKSPNGVQRRSPRKLTMFCELALLGWSSVKSLKHL